MDKRVTELENRVAFQDHTIQELNDVVTRQQQVIDKLSLDLDTLKNQVKNLTPSLVIDESEETPPPHY